MIPTEQGQPVAPKGTTPGSGKPQRLSYGPNEWQFGDLRLPAGAGPFPVVILIHGGFWKAIYGLDSMDALAADLTARSVAVWNIEYSRVGQPGGGWPGTLQDVAHAADYLRTFAEAHTLDLSRLITIGHSAGGQLSLWLAGRHKLPPTSELITSDHPLPITAAVSLAGVLDMEMMWRVRPKESPVASFLAGTPDEVPTHYAESSPRLLLPLGVPQIIIHGEQDDNVPVEISRSYAQAARTAGDEVHLLDLAGVEHYAVIDPSSEVWARTIDALHPFLFPSGR